MKKSSFWRPAHALLFLNPRAYFAFKILPAATFFHVATLAQKETLS